ncbi:MAG: hypothetical protein JO219_00830 [Candidatus Eremiobacteraeota bacterium]|nr:hypothetical protein [Candidatus Eremiobacteraeota bacterium]MBV8365531.1 hypothetical protein [Candidatus Eremiobacteraeota bacterium]
MRVAAIVLVTTAILFTANTPRALAKGTVQVQQSDGSVQTYPNSSIVVANKVLKITSADKQGTIVIERAACFHMGEIIRCLADQLSLDQGGKDQVLDLHYGTIYLNSTGTKQSLPATSAQLAPNGIMLSLVTKIGTVVNLTGTIDKWTK